MKEVDEILSMVKDELESATEKFGTFQTYHEGYAVILEELDELWDEVKAKRHDIDNMRKEAVQVAAMAIRFYHDLL